MTAIGQTGRCGGGGKTTDLPLVVLTNEFSASASEILSGAIQDHGRGTIVGTKTFGKGSVNILRRLSNEGAISITISRFFSPSGRLIEGEGLPPDVEVAHTDPQTADTMQLERAMETPGRGAGNGVRTGFELLLVADVKTIAVNRRARFRLRDPRHGRRSGYRADRFRDQGDSGWARQPERGRTADPLRESFGSLVHISPTTQREPIPEETPSDGA